MKKFIAVSAAIFGLIIGIVILLPSIIELKHGIPKICIDFSHLKTAVQSYQIDHGELPNSLYELVQSEKRPYLDRLPLDPWGRNYIFFKESEESMYIFGSLGKDGLIGGIENDRDVFSNTDFCGWSIP